MIIEQSCKINISSPKKISKALPVFYNPVMKLNRDLSVALLKAFDRRQIMIGLPLEGTGIRGIRFLKELKKEMIREIHFNDYDPKAAAKIKESLKLNNITAKKVFVHNEDANVFLEASKGFNYIDIDPFGTPNPFLDMSIKRLARDGILAVTATDTSALAGTYPSACLRKYWAIPMRNYLMHEIGLRILIRKVQLLGAQYDKALIPRFSYSKDHYYKIFFENIKGKSSVNVLLEQHQYFLFCDVCLGFTVDKYNRKLCCKQQMQFAGPVWIGSLFDHALTKKMELGTLELIKEESLIDIVGFYDIHQLVSHYKLEMPKLEKIIALIKQRGFKAARTHISPYGIRSTISVDKLIESLSRFTRHCRRFS